MMRNCVVLSLACLLSMTAATCQAAFSLGTPTASPGANITGSLTGFATNGAQMGGMTVQAYFADGGSQTRIWAASDPTSGGVTGDDWSLSQSGDTFNLPWTLVSGAQAAITRLVINALSGRTVFDILGNAAHTPGSALGRAMSSVTGDSGYDVVGTYRNAVSLNGTFYGDLYGTLDITFDRGYVGTLTWIADTDSASVDSRIDPVPEPASMLVWSLSALGLAYGRRRQVMKVA